VEWEGIRGGEWGIKEWKAEIEEKGGGVGSGGAGKSEREKSGSL